jgi:hypothetical protein
LKEGVNCGQPDVPSASAVLPATLKIVEEITNKRHVQIIELEVRRRFAQPFFCKMQEQAEGIAISRDGMRACPLLPAQAICKK